MGCIFRVGGVDFDVDACLCECQLEIYGIYRKGEAYGKSGRIRRHSGFGAAVSKAEFEDFPQQVEDAIAFLQDNADELRKLTNFPGIEGRTLDFPIADRDVAVQCDILPSLLLRLAGDLEINIEISRYPPATLDSISSHLGDN